MFNARSVSVLLLLAGMAVAQTAEKKTQQGEFEPYNEAV